jgi:RNA polymerase sigma factor (sigma-70 family)
MTACDHDPKCSSKVRGHDDTHLRMEVIVQRYERMLRKMARSRLGPGVLRLYDSHDFSQMVFLSFWKRISQPEFVACRSAHVLAFLRGVAKIKIADVCRRADRKSNRINTVPASSLDVVDPRTEDPSRAAEVRELSDAIAAKMSDEQRQLCELRNQKLKYTEIARQMGGTADARGMQYRRLLLRLRRDFV